MNWQDPALLALIVGGVEVVKRSAGLVSRWVPLVSIGVGIGAAVLWQAVEGGSVSTEALLHGLILGLASSGLYSGTKAISGN